MRRTSADPAANFSATDPIRALSDHRMSSLGGHASTVVSTLLFLMAVFPEFACAADASPFSGVTDFLKSIANLLIMEWGYYIGIITLAIQGYRWKTGRIDLMELGGWGLGIGLVFFAPNIVTELKNHAGTIN